MLRPDWDDRDAVVPAGPVADAHAIAELFAFARPKEAELGVKPVDAEAEADRTDCARFKIVGAVVPVVDGAGLFRTAVRKVSFCGELELSRI